MSRGCAIAAIAAGLLASSQAAAAPETALILSFVGRGGADLAPYIKPVAEAMPQLAPKWDAELRRRLEEALGESPRSLDTEKLDAIRVRIEHIEQGIMLGEGSANSGIQQLEGYRKSLADAHGSLALDPQARDLYFRVLLLLSRAYQIKDHPAPTLAAARMAELIESFSELPRDASLSPSMTELFQRMKAAAEKQKRVLVRLDRSNSPGAKVFVNGRLAFCSSPTSPICSLRVLPNASYAVFVSTPSGDGRMHRVAVGDLDTTVSLDIPFEAALSTERYIGLHFNDLAEQAKNEACFVERLGRETGFETVLVLSQSNDDKPGLRLKAYTIGSGPSAVGSASVGMLGGALTSAQVSELTHRVVEKFASKSGAPKLATTLTIVPPKASTKAPEPHEQPTSPKAGTAPKVRSPEELQAQATEAYVQGRYADAAAIAEQLSQRDNSKQQAAYRVKGASQCAMGDRKGVLETWKRLDDNGRAVVQYVCQRGGIRLP